jgi:hypothetical protein
MGLFDFLESIPLIGDGIKTVRKVVAPIVKKVTDFGAPLWNIAKKVTKFVPGASDLMEGVEAIGSEFVGGLKDDAQEAVQEIEDMGESVRDTSLGTYRQTREELEEGLGNLKNRGRKTMTRGRDSLKKLQNLGGNFMETLRNPTKWKEQYGYDDEDEEDNNLKRARKKARETRRRRRRQDEELD